MICFECMECGKRFRTTAAAERATLNGCPGCGGVDIDVETRPVWLTMCAAGFTADRQIRTEPEPLEEYGWTVDEIKASRELGARVTAPHEELSGITLSVVDHATNQAIRDAITGLAPKAPPKGK